MIIISTLLPLAINSKDSVSDPDKNKSLPETHLITAHQFARTRRSDSKFIPIDAFISIIHPAYLSSLSYTDDSHGVRGLVEFHPHDTRTDQCELFLEEPAAPACRTSTTASQRPLLAFKSPNEHLSVYTPLTISGGGGNDDSIAAVSMLLKALARLRLSPRRISSHTANGVAYQMEHHPVNRLRQRPLHVRRRPLLRLPLSLQPSQRRPKYTGR